MRAKKAPRNRAEPTGPHSNAHRAIRTRKTRTNVASKARISKVRQASRTTERTGTHKPLMTTWKQGATIKAPKARTARHQQARHPETRSKISMIKMPAQQIVPAFLFCFMHYPNAIDIYALTCRGYDTRFKQPPSHYSQSSASELNTSHSSFISHREAKQLFCVRI